MAGKNVSVRNITRTYGSVVAIDDLNFEVSEGEFVSLLGPSGCGKTTTLRIIAGLDTATTGDILVGGQRVNALPVHKRNFGMVFQNHALFPHKTAFENIAYGLQFRNVPKAEIKDRVQRALEVVRLPHAHDRLPSQLSGGQQQRVAVARAIVIEPDLLLFDEPLSALDANLREEMRVELKRIQADLGITTIFVTHDQAEALAMSDKIIVMNHGRKEQEGPPEEIFNRPRSEFVAKFFGQFTRFSAKVRSGGSEAAEVVVNGAAPATIRHGGLSAGQEVELLLRAEQLSIAETATGAPDVDVFPATVTGFEYLGTLVRYSVSALGTEVSVLQPPGRRIHAPGTEVQLHVRQDAWLALAGEDQ